VPAATVDDLTVHHWAQRGRWPVWAIACSALLALGFLPSGELLPRSDAAFFNTTGSSGTWAAAALFPTYSQAVIADGPTFYYRMNDSAGSSTAADSSGHASRGVYSPYTGADLETGVWPLDEGSGSTAADLAGVSPVNDLTLHSASWTASGQAGSALSLDGATGYAAAAAAVPTTTQFSTSAWVYLTSSAADAVAVSQSGLNISGFTLGYNLAANRWSFRMPRTDAAAAVVDAANSTAAPTLNRWTHLTGVFSGTQVRLYVDGVLQSTTGHTTTFAATGALEVGAALNTTRTAFWPGRVDDVRTWNARALPVNNVAELAYGITSAPHTLWSLEEGSGSTAYDNAGGLNTGTLGSGASWTATARVGTRAVTFPGTDASTGYVSGSSAAVSTSSDFSVAAWVWLSATGADAAAVSQVGVHDSGFVLGYDQTSGKWAFTLPRSDSGLAIRDTALSGVAAGTGAWTHLVGVFDSGTGTATLYVNGVSSGSVAHASAWSATGALQAGRTQRSDAWSAPWNGHLDDLRLYRRAITAAEVAVLNSGLYVGATTLGAPGALDSDPSDHAVRFGGLRLAAKSFGYNPVLRSNPTTFTIECWFRSKGYNAAVTTRGVTLVDFGSSVAGNSGASDRRLFVDATGHVVFGSGSGTSGMVSTSGAGYLDGQWHHVAASLDPTDGLRLYVDGVLAASASYSAPGLASGYWRFGGQTWFATWPAEYLNGDLDELALYPAVLTTQQVAWHYHADH
jgi:hypothetical protein